MLNNLLTKTQTLIFRSLVCLLFVYLDKIIPTLWRGSFPIRIQPGGLPRMLSKANDVDDHFEVPEKTGGAGGLT